MATSLASATASQDVTPPGSKYRRSVPTTWPLIVTSIDDHPWLAVVEIANLPVVGAGGGVGAAAMVNVTSVDAAPVPHVFLAFTREKYVPAVNVAVLVVVLTSVEDVFARPVAVPISTT